MTAREKLYHLSIGYHIADLIFNLWNICSPLAIITLLRVLFEKWGNPYSLEHFQECQLFIESLSTAQEGNYRDEELLLALKDKERHVRDIFVTLVRLAELNLQEAIDILVFAVKYKTSEVLQEEDNKGLYEITFVAFSKRVIETLNQRFIRDIFELILSIQSRCQFYNYEIAHSPPPKVRETADFNLSTLGVTIMTDKQPIVNFTQHNPTIGVNYAAEGSHIKFQQNVKNVTEQDLAEAAQKIQVLLNQLAQTYPTTTEPQKQTFIQKFLELIESTPDLSKVLLAGGIEWLKILCPPAGIPIEMSRRLYQAVQERHSQP